MYFPKASFQQFPPSKNVQEYFKRKTKRNNLEESSARRETSQESSIQRDESDNFYGTNVRDCLVDQNIRHTVTKLVTKYIVRWYVYSPKIDAIKQPENISLLHSTLRAKTAQLLKMSYKRSTSDFTILAADW